HDSHRDEVTMHTNSTRSSLEVPVTENPYRKQYQEQVHMPNVIPQPEQSAYIDYAQPLPPEYQQMQHPGIPPQHQQGSPVIYPTGMPGQQQPSGGPAPGGISFPEPHRYQ
ncbi:7357_t:CDS:1, partial [Acaulospora colombiana]